MAMGVMFGFYAIGAGHFRPALANTFSMMKNDVLTAVPLFLFMGYMIERSNILDRLFYTLQVACAHSRIDGGGRARHLRAVRHRHRHRGRGGDADGAARLPGHAEGRLRPKLSSGVVCAGGTLGILIPPSIMLIVYGATSACRW